MWVHLVKQPSVLPMDPRKIDPTAVGVFCPTLGETKGNRNVALGGSVGHPARCAPNTRCCAWLAHCDAHSNGQATNAILPLSHGSARHSPRCAGRLIEWLPLCSKYLKDKRFHKTSIVRLSRH